MNRFKKPDSKFNSLHFRDPWKEWLKGFKKRDEVTKDATQLSNEIYNYRSDIFPIRSIPVESNPGYVTHSRNFFRVSAKSQKTSNLLTNYFANDYGYNRDNISYGGSHGLGEFFEFVFQGLLVDGISYYAIEWGRVKLGARNYYLPVSLHYVNPATIETDEATGQLTQKFSRVAKWIDTFYEYKDCKFNKDELLIFKHPTLINSSPVAESIKYLKDLKQWITFSLWQGKANAEPTNYSLRVATSRYKNSDYFARQESITRLRVKRIFKQPIGDLRVGITTFYEVFAYSEYKKHLNIMRDYLVEVFNDQLLELVRQKNSFKFPIELEFRGFASNETIERAFTEYKNGSKTVSQFVDDIKDDFNRKLF